jgi:hypothetical protein
MIAGRIGEKQSSRTRDVHGERAHSEDSPMMARLHISLKRGAAIHVEKISVGSRRLVYMLVADKKMQYKKGRSRIAYIGTTKNGIDRVAQSVAARADEIFNQRGVTEFDVRIVTCGRRQHVKAWHKLERALLLTFREIYEQIPLCNGHGEGLTDAGEFDLFSKKRLRDVIEDLA